MNRLPPRRFGALPPWFAKTAPDGRFPRAAWSLLAIAGLMVALGSWLLASRSSGHASAIPSTADSASLASAGSVPEPAASAPSPAVPATACVAAGPPHVIAPSAQLAAAVEARSLGNDVALGFAASEQQAIAVRIDPASLSATDTTSVRTPGPIRRVTPFTTNKGELAVAVDVDQSGDRIRGRRTVAINPPVQIGTANGRLAWSAPGSGIKGKLWALEGDTDIEAVRGAVWERMPDAPDTILVAFRRSGALWLGAADKKNGLTAKRDLTRVPGLGAGIGSPTLAVNDGNVVAAWADRASPADPWRLRWVRFKANDEPGSPEAFAPPPGGKGGQAMSPAVSALPGGRFLLVWTEGPAAAHDVRALTLSADGSAIGTALAISKEGVNAGQAQAAVGPEGRGLVAFLVSDERGFQVVATPIVCPPLIRANAKRDESRP